ncbi:MAG TPA: TIGR02270 family protein [Tepidisphaeraceae bacterium]|nr:TIGR02270 family protein [Tepidisphaeraceae bacterium]
MQIIPDIVQTHCTEGAFLWFLRHVGVHSPAYDLNDLMHVDGRLDAHLDGLRIAGDEGWKLVVEELGWKEAGEFFVAALLAFESNKADRIEKVLAAVPGAPEGIPGVASALGWLSLEQARPHITRLLNDVNPVRRLIGLSASAIHRHQPGAALGKALIDPDLPLRARGLKAAGELGRTELIPALRQNLKGEDLPCRFWSAWSLLLLSNDPSGISAMRSLAETPSRFSERAAAMYARRAEPAAVKEWYRKQPTKPPKVRLALKAAAALGEIDAIPWLIGLMPQLPLSRLAGEAFTTLTGADLALLDLENKPPKDFQSGPNDNPADEDVSMDPDDNLPFPNPQKVAGWWSKNQSRFAPGTRYLLGQPMEIADLGQVLRIGKQRQRTAAAIELSMRQPGTPLFETRMPGFRQRQLLGC